MKVYESKTVVKRRVKAVYCNKCSKLIIKNNSHILDFLNINKRWGYGSKYDGQVHNFQLCEKCYDELINSFEIKIKKNV